MNVPTRYQSMTFDNWTPREGESDPRPMLRSWLANEDRPWSVVFLGPAGTGKTHLATATLQCFRGWPWWLDAAEAISLLREEARGPISGRTPVEQKFLDPRPLLIDDFASTRLTDFAHEKWTYALCYRYNHMLPTIITSNAESLEAFDTLDPRITSRLHDGLVIKLGGRDRRAA